MEKLTQATCVKGRFEKDLGVVLSAFRSVRVKRSNLCYVSMPITTGRRFYETLAANGVSTDKALAKKLGREALWELVIKPNIDDGTAFADRMGLDQGNMVFVAPSVFNANPWRWEQEEYMMLWFNVIADCSRHYLMDGWEYSLGGIHEVAFSLLWQWRYIHGENAERFVHMNNLQHSLPISGERLTEKGERVMRSLWEMRIFDSGGQEIYADRILKKCVDALFDLKKHGMDYTKHRRAVSWLETRLFMGQLHPSHPLYPCRTLPLPDDRFQAMRSPLWYESCNRLHSFIEGREPEWY